MENLSNLPFLSESKHDAMGIMDSFREVGPLFRKAVGDLTLHLYLDDRGQLRLDFPTSVYPRMKPVIDELAAKIDTHIGHHSHSRPSRTWDDDISYHSWLLLAGMEEKVREFLGPTGSLYIDALGTFHTTFAVRESLSESKHELLEIKEHLSSLSRKMKERSKPEISKLIEEDAMHLSIGGGGISFYFRDFLVENIHYTYIEPIFDALSSVLGEFDDEYSDEGWQQQHWRTVDPSTYDFFEKTFGTGEIKL